MTSIAAKLRALIEGDTPPAPKSVNQPGELMSPEMYAQLRALAHSYMRSERPGHTLQATAIVNEAYLRMVRSEIAVADQRHFFRLAAQAMRNILVDHARMKHTRKRARPSVEEMEVLSERPSFTSDLPLDLLDIEQALDVLANKNPRAAEIIELRYFIGQTEAEIAEMLGLSEKTVEREIRFVRAWITTFSQMPSAQL